MSDSLFAGANRLREAGIATLPIKTDGSKKPSVNSWKEFQRRLPTEAELHKWFGNGARPGIALICGKVSGNLEILDFDAPELIADWRAVVEETVPGLLDRLPQVETPTGGLHVFFRCPTIQGNQKLAEREVEVPEGTEGARQRVGRWVKTETAIETRGEGGYVITAGSPATCHPSGKLYRLINGDLKAIPTIAEGERETLLGCARSFNQYVTHSKHIAPECRARAQGLKPGEEFNQRGDVRALLERHGWKYLRNGTAGELWRRPGGEHTSATLFDNGALYVFSTNAQPFEHDRAYSPFAIFATLEHGGDFQAAAKALAAAGYGEPAQATAAKEPKRAKPSKDSTSADLGEGKAEKRSQTDLLIEVASAADFFFCVEEDEAYASVTIADPKDQNRQHQETYRVNSKPFRQYLSREYWLAEKKIPNNEALQNAVSHLAGQARFDGEQRSVFLRLAAHEGRIYWDLCNREWQMLEISDTGWRVIEAKDAPVRFRRTRGMLPLPMPVTGGNLEVLKQFVNYPDSSAWALHCAWLVAALRANARAFPVLIVNGEQGSAKSTACKITRRLIDPNTADLRPKPREDRDLYIAANNSWVCGFDNLSGLSRDLSDSICRIATGAGFGGRELFSDADETLFQVSRPVMLNGIDDLADKADLIDRGVFIELPPIPDEERKDEDSLWRDFDLAQPALLGALADAVVVALRELPKVKLAKLPRMADFAKWGVAANIGGNDTFINAYTGNRTKANEAALRANEIADLMIAWYCETDPVTTDLTTLLTQLTDLCRTRLASALACEPKKVKLPDGWPTTERKLSNELRRCAPNLRRAGVEVLDGGLDTTSRRSLRTFRRIAETPTMPVLNPSEASEASEERQSVENKDSDFRRIPEELSEGVDSNPSEVLENSHLQSYEQESFEQSFGNPSVGNSSQNQQVANSSKVPKVPKLPKQPQSESGREVICL